MRNRLASAVFLLLAAAAASAETRDWVFIVDDSRAMRRLAPDVKASIAAIPNAGDSTTTMTFERGHIGAALSKAFDAMAPRSRRECAIVLYTNAKEDGASIMSLTQRAQALRPSIFVVSLGGGEPQFDAFAEQTDRTQIFRPATGDAIRDVTRAIRKAVKPPEVSVSPQSISFGTVTAGRDSDERDITISSDKRVIVTVALANAAGVTMLRRDNVVITESAPAQLSLKVSVAKDADAGARELQLLVGEQIVPARVVINAPSLIARYGLIFAIIFVTFAAFAVVRIRKPAVRSTTLRA